MKKVFTTILLAMMALASWAYDCEVGGIYYNLDNENKTAEVTYKSTDYKSYSGSVTIPEAMVSDGVTYSVTSIGKYAFYKCENLTSVTIPNSITSIGEDTFVGCNYLTVNITSLESWCNISFGNKNSNPLGLANHFFLNGKEIKDLVIPNTVTSIGKYAFFNWTGMTSLTIGNSVTSIGEDAFGYCSGMTSLTIGNSVKSIGENAFNYCNGLTSVTIPDCVTNIEHGAFCLCKGLTTVTIGKSVTSIGTSAFKDCFNLTTIYFNAKNATVSSDGSFSKALTTIIIGNEVESVPENFAYSCTNLTTVTIGKSVTSIGNRAFSSRQNLKTFTCHAKNVPSMGENVFYYSSVNTATLNVYDTSLEDYKAADQWKDFGTFKPMLDLTDDTPTLKEGSYVAGNVIYTRPTTVSDYATFCLPYDISGTDLTTCFSDVYVPAPWCLYNTADESLRLMLNKQDNNTSISAGTPFIARVKTDNTVLTNSTDVIFAATTPNPTPTKLKVYNNDGGSVLIENTALVVKVGGTYSKLTGLDSSKYRAFTTSGSFGPCEWINCFRAYIYKDDSNSQSRIQTIVLDFGGDVPTGVYTISTTAEEVQTPCYNLAGQKVATSTMKSGLYIVNGKKVIKK